MKQCQYNSVGIEEVPEKNISLYKTKPAVLPIRHPIAEHQVTNEHRQVKEQPYDLLLRLFMVQNLFIFSKHLEKAINNKKHEAWVNPFLVFVF